MKILDTNAVEKINVGKSSVRHVSKNSKRASRILGTITNGDLPDDKKKELLTLKAVCGTQALLSQKNTMKKLQARAVDDAMPLNKLLEGFSKLK